MKTLPLQLKALEVIHLSDAIANDDVAKGLPERDAYVPLARQALLLLGSAYRELVGPEGYSDGSVVLQVTEEQAWLLRSKIRTQDLGMDNKTNIGIPLLLKLYDLLLQFNSELPDIRIMEHSEVDGEYVRKFLGLLKEENSARATSQDTNPYKSS